MKTYLKLLLVIPAVCICSTSFGQNRSIGANKLVLDDGLGHTVTIQTSSPVVTGILTLPSGTANLANTANGTVTGQTTRWNNATSQWEVSPSVTNVGSTLSNSGPIAATGVSGNISASGNIGSSGNVTASGYMQPGTSIGTSTPVSGGVYTDNMIQAAGATDINGVPYVQVGNYTIAHPHTGWYNITFAYNVATNPIVLAQAGANLTGAFVTNRTPLSIQILEFFPDGTTAVDGGFNFIVIGPHL